MRFMRLCLAALIIGASASIITTAATSSLVLDDLRGERRDIAEYRGSIVVLNFWATWCVPCREEMPILVRLAETRGADGVRVVGASADDPGNNAAIDEFVRDLGIGFPIWIGATTADMERLGLGDGLPATAIIDRDGSVVARTAGVVDEKRLNAWIDWLLGDRAAPVPRLPGAEPGDHAHDDHHHEGGVGVALDGPPSLVPS